MCNSVEGEGAMVCTLVAPFRAEAWMCVTPLVEGELLMVLTVMFLQVVLVNAAPHSSQICYHISTSVLWVRDHGCLF